MTKAFSILHRAAALLVALCLLVGMALPVYAAEDEALFFDAGSETIPTVTTETTAEESTEPEQNPVVTDSETVPDKENTPPAANEPGTEAGNTVNNTAAVPNNDGKTQEGAENQTPAADTDTVPADPALTNKTPADTSDTAAAPNHAINAEETTAAKNNTEQDVLFADGDNPNEEDTMLADDLPDNDDANSPDTIADTSSRQRQPFILRLIKIYSRIPIGFICMPISWTTAAWTRIWLTLERQQPMVARYTALH